MSIDVMNRIWWREDLPAPEKWTLMALADAANDDGFCWMGVKTIGIKTTLCERAVQNALKSLEAKLLLRIQRRPNRSSLFLINIDMLPQVARVKQDKDIGLDLDLFAWGASAAPDDMTGASHAVTGASHAVTGASHAPRNIIETSEETLLYEVGDFKSPELQEPDVISFVETEWAKLASEFKGVAACRGVDSGLAAKIRTRAKEFTTPGMGKIQPWVDAFAMIRSSIFLTGRAPPGKGRTSAFRMSISWAVNKANFRNIIEGMYNGQPDSAYAGPNGERLGDTASAVHQSIARLDSARERAIAERNRTASPQGQSQRTMHHTGVSGRLS